MDLAALASAFDDLASSDPGTLADPDTVMTLCRARVRLDVATCAVLAAFEDTGAFGKDGSRSAAAWSAAHCHLAPKEARRSVGLGREMAQMACFASACRTGDLSGVLPGGGGPLRRPSWRWGTAPMPFLEVAAQGLSPRCVEVFDRDKAMLVDQAKALSFADFARVMAYWV